MKGFERRAGQRGLDDGAGVQVNGDLHDGVGVRVGGTRVPGRRGGYGRKGLTLPCDLGKKVAPGMTGNYGLGTPSRRG